MTTYDTYYKTQNLFGEPYPELITYMDQQPRGKVLDLGSGQGRNAVALATMGFEVLGIDTSKLGIAQMLEVATQHDLAVKGLVQDIYEFEDFVGYIYILYDSMFHFTKRDTQREKSQVTRTIESMAEGAQLLICIQDTGTKVRVLEGVISESSAEIIARRHFTNVFEDTESKHHSETAYQMIVVSKRGYLSGL